MWLEKSFYQLDNRNIINSLLDTLIKINADIKYMQNPKYYIEATFMGGLK